MKLSSLPRFFVARPAFLCALTVALLSLFWWAAPRVQHAAAALPALQASRISPDGVWQELERATVAPEIAAGIPAQARAYRLLPDALARVLARAPQAGSRPLSQSDALLTVPLPDGRFSRFRIEEASVFEPGLAARFPTLKSYRGQGFDDARMSVRAAWSPQGLHALVLGPDFSVTLQPARWGGTLNYVSYFGASSPATLDALECAVEGKFEVRPGDARRRPGNTSIGPTRRTYRIAISTTGEYAQSFGGGTLNGTLDSINVWLTAINAIYERELGLQLSLVNNTNIIYTDAGTDPYTPTSTLTLLNQVRTELRDKVGAGNYDVGHLLGVGSSGLAFVGATCNNGEFNGDNNGPVKGGGVSLISPAFSNAASTNLIAHEIGHLFGAQHTFNATMGACAGGARSAVSAVETGAGLTIMSYAGNCAPDNIIASSELRFHAHSFTQIRNYVTNSDGAMCGTAAATGNNPPAIDGGTNFTIPKQTPFTLTATGSDPDAGDAANLTYAWEQVDAAGTFSNPPYSDSGDAAQTTRPIFRPYSPSSANARTFPALTYILNNANVPPATINGYQTAENLPAVARTLNFRVVARDQRGGVNDDDVQLTVEAGAGPFLITSPNAATSWLGGTQQTVTWSVNGTNAAPINCANVNILLSTDGGLTFPRTLASNTPNDGSEQITVPQGVVTSQARIKVQAIGNIFFDINDANLAVSPGDTCPAVGNVSPLVNNVGASVLITGANLNDVTQVRFSGNANASFVVLSNTILTATVPAGAASGPISVIKPGCPNVETPYFTVCPNSPSSLLLDDGTLEQTFGFTSGSTSAYVTRLTPTSYPATLSTIIASINSPSNTPVEIIYAANTDGDANIDGLAFQSFSTTVLQQASFVGYNVPPLTINAGDFVVGFRVVPATGILPAMLDTSSAPAGRSYFSNDGANFTLFSASNTAGNLAVRAVIFGGNCGGGGSQCPTVSTITPDNGGIGALVTITGTNLTGVSAVKFSNNITAQFTVVNDTTITATVPSGASTGPITLSKTGCPDAQTQSFTVNCPVITVNPANLSAGTVNAGYNQPLTATAIGGGNVTYTFTVVSGALPPGLTLTTGGLLSGTPTQSGTFNFTVNATDSNGCAGTRAYSLVINCQSITVNPTSLPNGTAGSPYNQTLTQTGAVGAVTWNLSTGALPTGLTFSATGQLAGTPTQTGTFNITAQVTDANGCTGSQAYTLVINCQSISISPSVLPVASTVQAYSVTFTQTGALGTVTWSVTGTLPNGLTLNPMTGVLSGTPTQTGTFNITITATDSNQCAGMQAYALEVSNCASISLSPTSLPAGNIGTPYNQMLSATGGATPYSFTVLSGTLPPGLMLATNGALTGTPTTAGTFNFTVRATDANLCTGDRSYTLQIGCPTITLLPTSLANGAVGTPFSQQFAAIGGAGSYTYSVLNGSGNLPPGLSLTTGGLLSGTPTQGGSFSFAITATDLNSCVGSRAYTLTITSNCPTITLTPTSLPNGMTTTPYSQTLSASGGTAPYTFNLDSGTLPLGLFLTTGGQLLGTPQQPGTFSFTIFVTDANNCFGSRNYTVGITCGSLTVNPANIAQGFSGAAYSQTFTQSGGSGLITWSVSAGTLPPGLLLDSVSGVLSGTPTTLGVYNFTIKAADASNCMGTRAYTLVVSGNGLQYFPLPKPIRLFDTRATIPGFPACAFLNQAIAADGELVRSARITCDGVTIPNNAAAIVGNATVTGTTGVGFLTLYPDGQARPPVATLTYGAGDTTANAFTVGLSGAGEFRAYSFAGTHLIVDVAGYFAPPATNGLYYHPLPKPIRLFDTRATIPGFPACAFLNQAIAADSELLRSARITCDGVTIPNDALAISGNATVTGTTGFGFLTLYPNGQTRPPVATLNYGAAQTIANAFTVGLDAAGQFRAYSFAGTHLIIDVTGYYSASPSDANGLGLLYSPLTKPIRLFDTRATIPGFPACEFLNQPLVADGEIVRSAHLTCDGVTIPTSAQAIVGNATVTGPTGFGFLTLYPEGQTRPPVATLNYATGQTVPNAFTVGLNGSGQFRIYSFAGTHLITDVNGYFAP